jgi:hypothetical protein
MAEEGSAGKRHLRRAHALGRYLVVSFAVDAAVDDAALLVHVVAGVVGGNANVATRVRLQPVQMLVEGGSCERRMGTHDRQRR